MTDGTATRSGETAMSPTRAPDSANEVMSETLPRTRTPGVHWPELLQLPATGEDSEPWLAALLADDANPGTLRRVIDGRRRLL